MDEETLKKQMERLKRAIRTAGPSLADGEKRKSPVVLSAATRAGVTETLRDLVRIIDAAREADAPKVQEAWHP